MSPILKIVEPSGILAGDNASRFRHEISKLIESGVDMILIDFQNVTFIDSSGVGALVFVIKSVRSHGAKIFICSLNDQLKMLFELASIDQLFKVFANRDEFNKAVIISAD